LRVVAARFREPRRAVAVLHWLHDRLNIAPPDADVAALGTPGQPATNDAVLAGRFPDEQASLVMDLIRRAGGEVVANIDERWTRPRPDRRPMRGTNNPCLRSHARPS
jgi:hypothetical protein